MRKVLKIFGIIILFILLILLSLILYFVISFRSWEKGFVANANPQYMVNESLDLQEVVQEGIADYILSGSDTEFIEFTPEQVGQVIYGSVSEILGDTPIELSNIYVEPSKGVWSVCGRFASLEMEKLYAWVCIDVAKDDVQTAQLYLEDIHIQNISASKVYPKAITLANQGLAEALLTANENGFVGRIFENIELLDDMIVVKGSLY